MQKKFNESKFSFCKDLVIPGYRQQQYSKSSKKDLNTAECFTDLCGCAADELELPVHFKWTNEDVLEWIDSLGFPQYQNAFKVNFINGRTLLRLDATALVRMNIKDFAHIRKITKSIREMYRVELEKFDRSISLPPRNLETIYKFYKVSTGPIYELCSRTELFKKMKLMCEAKVQLNHFEKLHEWLKHIPDLQTIRIGNIKRDNLYFVKPNPCRDLEPFVEQSTCHCEMPPCECKWSESEKRAPWTVSFLLEVEQGKYDETICSKLEESNVLNLVLLK